MPGRLENVYSEQAWRASESALERTTGQGRELLREGFSKLGLTANPEGNYCRE